jgi:hypothetical protein
MFNMKFMDGTPVPVHYAERVAKLVSGACEAVEQIGEDGLERHAREQESPATDKSETRGES